MGFQAYSATNGRRAADTPKAAARAFFAAFPKARKCNIIEGKSEGGFFTVTYGRKSNGEWPQSFKDVTKRSAENLPD